MAESYSKTELVDSVIQILLSNLSNVSDQLTACVFWTLYPCYHVARYCWEECYHQWDRNDRENYKNKTPHQSSCAVLQIVLYPSNVDKNTHSNTGDAGTAGGPITTVAHSYFPQQDHHLPPSLLLFWSYCVGLMVTKLVLLTPLGALQQVWKTLSDRHFWGHKDIEKTCCRALLSYWFHVCQFSKI